MALPDIGKAFDASQTALNLVAVSYSLGLAASVLYLGAIGDRYGRKLLLILGVVLSVPACLLAAWAPSVEVLVVARLLGGLSAGMAYPTTLALITALWSGPARTKSIALWSALGGAISSLGPLTAGALLEEFWWGSVFLITLPLAVVALVMAVLLVPSHVHETTDPVDNLGGLLSIVLVASLVLAINFAPVPDAGALVAGLAAIALAAGIAFFIRQRRVEVPLYDLHVAGRRTFWVAACAGSDRVRHADGGDVHRPAVPAERARLLDGRGRSSDPAGGSDDGADRASIGKARRSPRRPVHPARRLRLLPARLPHDAAAVGRGQPYWAVGLGYALVGAGVGFAGTPASHSLTGSVPVIRAGMASGTADLQRDLGGAIMQSILGALLTAGYASAVGAAIAASPDASEITDSVQTQLQKSFAGAEEIAEQYPQYADQITAAATSSFLDGADWAYVAGIIAILIGAAIVSLLFPRRAEEQAMLARYHAGGHGAASEPGVGGRP